MALLPGAHLLGAWAWVMAYVPHICWVLGLGSWRTYRTFVGCLGLGHGVRTAHLLGAWAWVMAYVPHICWVLGLGSWRTYRTFVGCLGLGHGVRTAHLLGAWAWVMAYVPCRMLRAFCCVLLAPFSQQRGGVGGGWVGGKGGGGCDQGVSNAFAKNCGKFVGKLREIAKLQEQKPLQEVGDLNGPHSLWGIKGLTPPPPLCISYANVYKCYGPFAYCGLDKGVAYTRAMRQRILGSHTPPCHRRMVITTLSSMLYKGGGYPPPPCISYALVQATVGVGTVIIWYLILFRYQT